MKKQLFLISALLVVATCAWAQSIYYVNGTSSGDNNGSSWSDAYVDLQDAVEVAIEDPDAIIYVAAGTYSPGTGKDNAFILTNDVKIYGGFLGVEDDETIAGRDLVANETILSGGDNSHHVLIFVNSNATLDGLTITGGNANGSGDLTVSGANIPRARGAGMYIHNGAPILNNIIITENVTNNTSGRGGGIFNSGGSPVLTNVIISENKAYRGAGMYNNAAAPVLNKVTFHRNESSNNGAGMNNETTSAVITDCIFSENKGAAGGGLYDHTGSSSKLYNVTVSGNTTTGNAAGVFIDGSSTLLVNVAVTDNTSNNYGGGIGIQNASNAVFVNVTVSGNKAVESTDAVAGGGGLWIRHAANAKFYNTIFAGNASDKGDGARNEIYSTGTGTFTYNHSLVEGKTATDLNNSGSNNLSGNAVTATNLFVNPAEGNFALTSGSPAIDAGSYTYWENADAIYAGTTLLARLGITTAADLIGANRVHNTAIDLGAYEYDSPVTTTIAQQKTGLDIYGAQGGIVVKGISANTNISVYSLTGVLIHTKLVIENETFIDMPNNGIYVIKAGAKTAKVVVK